VYVKKVRVEVAGASGGVQVVASRWAVRVASHWLELRLVDMTGGKG
jgi:hypothetical protein